VAALKDLVEADSVDVAAKADPQERRKERRTPPKRLMGLEPTTFCMASSDEGPLFQQECGFSAAANAVRLLPITGHSDTI
jgi:hypothetical protein